MLFTSPESFFTEMEREFFGDSGFFQGGMHPHHTFGSSYGGGYNGSYPQNHPGSMMGGGFGGPPSFFFHGHPEFTQQRQEFTGGHFGPGIHPFGSHGGSPY